MKEKKKLKLTNFIYPIIYCYKIDKWYMLLVFFSSLLTSSLNIFNIYILKILTESVISGNSKEFIKIIIIMLSLTFIVNTLNAIAVYRFQPIMKNKINQKIQQDIYQQSYKYNMADFDDKNFFDLYYYVIENSKDSIISGVSYIVGILTNVISIVGIAAIMINYDKITIIGVIVGVILSTIISMHTKRMQYSFNIESILPNRKIKYVDRIFYLKEFVKEIKTYKSSNLIINKYEEAWDNLNSVTRKWMKKIGYSNFFITSIDSLTYICILAYLGLQALIGIISISAFMVVFNGAQQLISQIKSVIAIIPAMFFNAINLNKYFEYMEYNKGIESKNELDTINQIQVEHVNFKYNNFEKNILQDISLVINKGEHIAIVGENGSGKSTLIKLIMGLYEPTDGDIIINGYSEKDMDLDLYRSRIAVVYQDFQLFAFSIAQNVVMKHEITKEDERIIKSALEKVNLWEKIRILPEGIYTNLSKEFDNNGLLFSGGELQRLALARAYAQNSEVIIMDEAFSAFDAKTEKEISKSLMSICKEKTLIFITHSLANLSSYDKILVMSNGRIVENGSHHELLAIKGFYSNLIKLQLEKYC